MKITKLITGLALGGAFAALIGCGQQESAAPRPSTDTSQKPAVSAAPAPVAAAPKLADIPAPEEMATPPAPIPAATDQVQTQIDKAKALIAEKKYSEALAALKELSALKLTPDQQTMVDALKAQVTKAMTSAATADATKSVGGLPVR